MISYWCRKCVGEITRNTRHRFPFSSCNSSFRYISMILKIPKSIKITITDKTNIISVKNDPQHGQNGELYTG